MKKALTLFAGAGLFVASTSIGFACPFHSASEEQSLTVAETPAEQVEEAASTFDPEKLQLEEEKSSE